MGTHHAPHRPDGLGGLVGRGALTAAAALALAGGGTGVAFAGDGPTGGDQDAASHSADHGDDCSCGGHDGQERDGDEGYDGHGDSDEPDSDAPDSDAPDSHDSDWMSFGSDDDQDGPDSGSGTDRGERGDGGDRGDRASGTTHRAGPPTRSHAPSTENIAHGAAQGGATTIPIRSGVMR